MKKDNQLKFCISFVCFFSFSFIASCAYCGNYEIKKKSGKSAVSG
jgi:hypothetical protein